MSLNARQIAELEAARREEVRRGQVRAEVRALLQACEAAVSEVRDVATQQYASERLAELRGELPAIAGLAQMQPDTALAQAREASAGIRRAIADAGAKAKAWTEEHVTARAAVDLAADRLGAVRSTELRGSSEELRQAEAQVAQAAAALDRGDLTAATAAVRDAEAALELASAAALREAERREVVRELLNTLKEMGFDTPGPRLRQSGAAGDPGVVVLMGEAPSGKIVRVEVSLDGRIDFGLDGYAGRTCKDDLDAVERVLSEHGLKLGPPQVVWKAPDADLGGAKRRREGGRRKRGSQRTKSTHDTHNRRSK